MLKTLTKKLRRHSLNEIHPFQLKISYHGSEEGGESEDSEEENQELAQIDRDRRRNCALTPLATSQQHNQDLLSPAHLRRLRVLLDPGLDRHSSEEELERISRDFLQSANAPTPTAGMDSRKWTLHHHYHHYGHRHGDHSSASSDEEVKNLCGLPMETGNRLASPSPVLFSSSPPRSLKAPGVVRLQTRPIITTHFEQPTLPYWRHRPAYSSEPRRPSLDLEKMQQKMQKKSGGGKTRTIKIRNLTGSRPPPRYAAYDPSIFAFRSLSTAPPSSPLIPSEEPPCI
ncbi:uncharacterized protein LOC114802696 [Denticeps clupeoides]|uniref:Uncharacterized protein n=1 Tax=Denticeps clupeoides TaxID=299321 RepID=A0AAY4AFV4_9TELE|nr:uncharacterized protein LOC114802696 [Denticeps clupeoides]